MAVKMERERERESHTASLLRWVSVLSSCLKLLLLRAGSQRLSGRVLRDCRTCNRERSTTKGTKPVMWYRQVMSNYEQNIELYKLIHILKSAEVPVPKLPRPQSVQNDLRPNSLLPSVAKVFESIVGQWFISALEPSCDPNQFGCRRHRSTTHALIAMTHAWQSALDRDGAVRALFMDFRKTFDLVIHNT